MNQPPHINNDYEELYHHHQQKNNRQRKRKTSSHSSLTVTVDNTSLKDVKPCYAGLIICLVFFFIVVFIASVVSLVAWFNVDRRLDVYTYSLTFEGDDKLFDSIPGDLNALGFGMIKIDSHSRCINWEFFIQNLDSQVTKIDLMGPIKSDNPLVTTSVFKELTTASNINVKFEDSDELSRSRATDIAKAPWKYYILIRTQNKPDGAVRAQLGNQFFVNKNP